MGELSLNEFLNGGASAPPVSSKKKVEEPGRNEGEVSLSEILGGSVGQAPSSQIEEKPENSLTQNMIKAPLFSALAGFNKANSSFLGAIGLKKGKELSDKRADYWEKKAGTSGLVKSLYEGIGSAPMGIAEFIAGPGYAGVKGTLDSLQRSLEKKDYSNSSYVRAVKDGAIASVSRFGIGKTFEAINAIPLTQIQRAGVMGAVFGFQSGAEQKAATGTVDLTEITASVLTGITLSMGGVAGEKAEIYKNLIKEGVPSKEAMNMAVKDNPSLQKALEVATDFTGVVSVPDFKASQVVKDLEVVKKPSGGKEEQLSLDLKTPEAKVFSSSQGGMVLSDVSKKVVVEDIDGMYSEKTGFDPAKVALRNAAMEKFKIKYGYYPDVISASSHRQGSLILKDLSLIQEEYKENGLVGRVAGVTPDFGADTPTVNKKGLAPIRGNEVSGIDSQFLKRLGSEIIAVLDDRTDLGKWGKKQIVTTGGLAEKHISQLEILLGVKEPPTVQELVGKIAQYDKDLKAHGEHVAGIAMKMARVLNIPENIKHDLMYGAWLHDYGKIKVSKEILFSDKGLTPEQFKEIEKHPRKGLEEIETSNVSETVKNIVFKHHERFDGKGYPEKKKGSEIPIEAQIVSAADVYDALTTNKRSYRKEASQEELLKIFEEMRGHNFDPRIIDALFEVVGLKAETLSNKGKIVYHGTTAPIDKLTVKGGDENALYGPGIYTTENAKIASEYAEASGVGAILGKKEFTSLSEAQVFLVEAKEKYGRATLQTMNPQFHEVSYPRKRAIREAQPNVLKLLVDIKNPFDADKGYSIKEANEIVRKVIGETPYIDAGFDFKINGGDIYKRLADRIGKVEVNKRLEEIGYDGITHIGGKITGGEEHRVWIAFKDEQVTSFFSEQIARAQVINLVTKAEIENDLKTLSVNEKGVLESLKKPKSLGAAGKDFTTKETIASRKEANKRLKEEFQNVEKLAKEEKISIEEYLTKFTEMEPEQVRDFLLTGKELSSGEKVIERSLGREVGRIKTALGLTGKELEVLVKQVTDFDSFKDLAASDKEKVKEALLFLYKSKFGEDFKSPKKTSIRKAVKEADRVFVETSLSKRGFFGLKEVTARLASDGEQYLRTHGPSAKALADKLSTIRLMSDLRYAEMATIKKNINSKLSEKDKERVFEIVSSYKTEEFGQLHDSREVKAAATFYREKFNEIAEDMIANGVKITNLKGEKVPFEFDSNEPYWPRYYDPETLLRPGRKHDAAIKQMITKGYADTPAQAEVLLDRILSRRMNSPKYGNMEYAREFDVEGFEKNIDIVFDNYFLSTTKRLEVIKAFGQNGKGALELLGNIKRESGDYVYKYATDINKRIVGGSYAHDPVAQIVSDVAVSYEVLTKMGRAGLRNLGQSANTIGTSYTKSSLKALGHIFSDPRTVMDRAERSAAMLHSYANEFARFENEEPVSAEFLSAAKLAEGMKNLSDKSLTYTGFKHSEIFNRLFAAETGREYATDLFREFQNSPIDSGSRKRAAMRLEKLGLKPEEILASRTELNEFDRRTASYNFVRQTQFVNDAMSLPRWVSNESPWIKMLTLFKTFGIQQAKLVYRTLKSDPLMAAKLIPVMAISGGITAEAIDFLTGKIRDDETLLQQLSRYFASGGGFGLWADTVQNSMRSSSGLAEALSGVVIGDIGTKGYALKLGIVDDNWDAFRKTMVRDIPIIGPTIHNTMEEGNIKW